MKYQLNNWEDQFDMKFPDVIAFTENRDHKDISEEIKSFIASAVESAREALISDIEHEVRERMGHYDKPRIDVKYSAGYDDAMLWFLERMLAHRITSLRGLAGGKCCERCWSPGKYPYEGNSSPYCMYPDCECHKRKSI